MMHNWFLVKVRYEKTTESGRTKKVTELYLFDALSFTEAEARAIEEMTPFISGEFTINDISRANYSELFDQFEGDKYFKCKVQFVTIDEKAHKEVKKSTYILVPADTIEDARKNLDEGMKGTLADYVTASISETQIMDVYPFNADPKDSPEFPLVSEDD
jgi:hypothetical protein